MVIRETNLQKSGESVKHTENMQSEASLILEAPAAVTNDFAHEFTQMLRRCAAEQGGVRTRQNAGEATDLPVAKQLSDALLARAVTYLRRLKRRDPKAGPLNEPALWAKSQQGAKAQTLTIEQRFKSYCLLADFFLEMEEFEGAEACAVLALKSIPATGQKPYLRRPSKVLSSTLSARGLDLEAALAGGVRQIPDSIQNKHFADYPRRSCTSESAGWQSVKKLKAFPSGVIPLTLPLHLPEHAEAVANAYRRTEIRVAEAYTSVLPEGRIWFDGSVTAWDRSGRVVEDLSRGLSAIAQASAEQNEPTELRGRICLLGNRNPANYYHWMNDVLPRLAVLKRSGMDLNSIDRFILKPLTTRFQKETLEHFGIDRERMHFITDGCYLQADEVLIPVFGGGSMGLEQGRWNPEFLKAEFLDNPHPKQHRRLYISRGKAATRRVFNEDKLLSTLSEHGFEVVQSEKMSIREQAALFSEAEIVMGAHGAGFTNTAFCQPGTRVVELFSDFMAPCFWAISAASDLVHHGLFCGGDKSLPDRMNRSQRLKSLRQRNQSGFEANLRDVAEFLDYMGMTR